MNMHVPKLRPDPAGTRDLLVLERIGVSYGRGAGLKPVLRDLTLRVAAGEAIGIVGESGSGKTTLAKVVLGAVPTQAGTVTFDGRTLTGLGEAERRRFRRSGAVQYVFQDPLGSLDPDWTAFQSIEEALLLKGIKSKPERQEAVIAATKNVGLDPDLLQRRPGQLSGGQRQRIAIARALVANPRLLISDEPVSALDSSSRVHVLELFSALRERLRLTQLFISHDLGSVAALVDRVVVLYQGQIVEDGTPSEVIGNPRHDYTRKLVAAAPRLRIDA